MRIVLKIDDNSELARQITRRMQATGLERATVARMMLFQVIGGNDVAVETTTPPLPPLSSHPEEVEAFDSIPDDDPLLGNLLMDM
jgi:antitoxin component of RelBE/YafQ-DinJ toxin-antitoxin module